jgi:exodeoxyribonuclease V alpha subunit
MRAGIFYTLTETMDEGRCGLPVAELAPLAEKLVDMRTSCCGTALDLELADGT